MAKTTIEFANGDVVTVEGDDADEVEVQLDAVSRYFTGDENYSDDGEPESPIGYGSFIEPTEAAPLADWERELLDAHNYAQAATTLASQRDAANNAALALIRQVFPDAEIIEFDQPLGEGYQFLR